MQWKQCSRARNSGPAAGKTKQKERIHHETRIPLDQSGRGDRVVRRKLDSRSKLHAATNVLDGRRTEARATLWTRDADGHFEATDLNSLLPPESGWFFEDVWAVSQDGRLVSVHARDYDGAILLELDEAGAQARIIPLGACVVWDIRLYDGDLRMTGSLQNQHAFVWDGEAFIDLHPSNLPGTSSGWGVNHMNQTAGVYRVNGVDRPAYWDEQGNYLDLFAGKATGGAALGINEAGYVVGWASLKRPGPASMVFLWHPTTGALDVNSLLSPADTSGLTLNWAGKINHANQILARGSSKNTGNVYVLMHP
jgi:hypothetical protein